MLDTTGACAAELVPTGPGTLVEQLNSTQRRTLLWPWVAGAAGLLVLVAAAGSPIAAIVLAVLAVPGVVWFVAWERPRHTVVTFYDVTGPTASWYDGLVAGYPTFTSMAAAWRIEASGAVQGTYQYKVNSGAGSLVRRSPIHFTLRPPPSLTTNILVPSMVCGRHALLFLPDRVLARSGKRWSDVSYEQLHVAATSTRFIEAGSVPHDSVQVDTTWQYVNVRGGPDRRFKSNRMLPVMLYGELVISSPSGLYWQIDCSRPAVASWFAEGMSRKSA